MSKKILPFVFFVSIFIIFFLPLADNDFGWHYRCGKNLIEQGKPCISNEFSYFLSDYQWALPDFIYDAAIVLVFDNFGFLGLSILGTIIFSIITSILFFPSKLSALVKVIIIYLAIFFSWSVFQLGFRSQIVSILFTLITVSFLIKSTDRLGKKTLLLLVPLFLIWANTHPGFFLGPVIFSIFVFSKFFDFLAKRINLKDFGFIFLIFVSSGLATLANPFFYRVYIEVFHHWQMPLNTLIAEWTKPLLTHQLFIIFLSATFLFFFIQSKVSLFSLMIVALFAYFSLSSRRNLPIFYFTYALLLLKEFPFNLRHRLEHWQPFLEYFALVLITSLTIIYGFSHIRRTLAFDTNWNNYCRTGYVQYPCQAVKFLKGKTGNIFNTYEWGGFLIWQLPEMKVFVDGRMPAWIGENNESPYTTWLKILQTRPGWNKKLDQYGTDYLLIGRGVFLDLLLQPDPEKFGYNEEYRDEMAVIYRRIKEAKKQKNNETMKQ